MAAHDDLDELGRLVRSLPDVIPPPPVRRSRLVAAAKGNSVKNAGARRQSAKGSTRTLDPAPVIQWELPDSAGQGDMFGHDALSDVLTVGIDEAGRGPLAGAVYAAAVILDPDRLIEGLADSKILKAAERERLALQIQAQAVAWCIARAEVAEIDSMNILQATFLAMERAMAGLHVRPLLALVDGNQAPKLKACAVQTVVKGDSRVPAISAASILAKTARDADLLRLHAQYPVYGFDQHKGYGTALHLARLREHGPCPEHRRSFAPVRMLVFDVTHRAASPIAPARTDAGIPSMGPTNGLSLA